MVKVELIEPGSFSVKLLAFYLVLFFDVCTNSFTYYSELTYPSDAVYGTQSSVIFGITIFGLQVIIQIVVICWIFVLVWSTFLFKYGLIGILCSEFKTLFLNLPIHIILFLLEKGLRFLIITSVGAIDLWDNAGYEIVYWIRSFYLIYFYLLLVKISLDLGDPVYYKADKWLEINR